MVHLPYSSVKGHRQRKPVVSPDGKFIAFFYRSAPAAINKIAIMPMAGGEPRLISDLPAQRLVKTGQSMKRIFFSTLL